MSILNQVSIVIPSLNPPDSLIDIVDGLLGAGFEDIILVNDGSDDAHTEVFTHIEEDGCCTVLTHAANMGKGVALKTAFAFFKETRPEKAGVITMDADGQHLIGDVVKCAHALIAAPSLSGERPEPVVMGVRDFRRPGVPRRNAMGNRITAFAFRVLFGIKLRDTQTGLRGFRSQYIPLMLEIKGDRFEYETNMLVEIERNGIPFLEVEIEPVYEEGSNDRSHYRPFKDSAVIFTRIAKYAVSSIICFLVDISVFYFAMMLLKSRLGVWGIPVCTAIGRLISSFINFNANRRLVFRRKKAYGSHLWRYYTLAIAQMCVSAAALWLLALPLGGSRTADLPSQMVSLLTLIKALVDTALFFISYNIQRKWVFRM